MRRPVVILTRASILDHLGEVKVAPITGTIRDIPSEAVLTPHDGMTNECAVNCDHLQTVPRLKVGGLIAILDETKMVEVSRAVRFALNL
jgi:mRNA interferase MazF